MTRPWSRPAEFPDASLWRASFVVYAGSLALATHWPRLRFPAGVPGNDKTVHLLAFAGLAFLIWRTRWFRSRWAVLVVALAWALLDEASQAIPGLYRHVAWPDLVANALGVIVTAAWLWAMRPVGGTLNRERLDLDRLASDVLFANPRTWLVAAGILIACAAPVAIVWSLLDPTFVARMVLLAILAWLSMTSLALVRAWQQARVDAVRRRACFRCGASCRDARFEDGRGRCPQCGRDVQPSQWTPLSPPGAAARLRLAAVPALASLLAVVLVRFALPPSRSPLPETLAPAVYLAVGLTLLALATRVYRRALARHYDRAMRCRGGTPAEEPA